MKTADLTALIDTDTIVRIETAKHSGCNWGRVVGTEGNYITTSDEWSHNGVEIAVVTEDGAPVSERVWDIEAQEYVLTPKVITLAPSQVKETKDEHDARRARQAEQAEQFAAEQAAKRKADEAAKRPLLTEAFLRYGSTATVDLDEMAWHSETLATLLRALNEADVQEVAPNVYRVTMKDTATSRLIRADFEELSDVTVTMLDFEGEFIDLDRGRSSGRALGATQTERMAGYAILGRIA